MFLQADITGKGALNLKEEKILGYIRQISATVDAHCRTTSDKMELTPMQCFCIVYIHENRRIAAYFEIRLYKSCIIQAALTAKK